MEREIAQWVHPMKDRSDDHRTMSERSYHGATSRSLWPIEPGFTLPHTYFIILTYLRPTGAGLGYIHQYHAVQSL